MPPFLPLFARRASDPPRYRVARVGAPPGPGHAAYSPIERGASLIAEPLASRTQRAGDLPLDLVPETVPLGERHPMAGLKTSPADADALPHLRAAATVLRITGVGETEDAAAALDVLDLMLARQPAGDVDVLAAQLAHVVDMASGGERGISPAEADTLREPLEELGALGLRAPLERLDEYESEEASMAETE